MPALPRMAGSAYPCRTPEAACHPTICRASSNASTAWTGPVPVKSAAPAWAYRSSNTSWNAWTAPSKWKAGSAKVPPSQFSFPRLRIRSPPKITSVDKAKTGTRKTKAMTATAKAAAPKAESAPAPKVESAADPVTETSLTTNLDDSALYMNRELSLLEFQRRVLEEAGDPGNKLLERVKFASIIVSNLDEFYMVRVAAMKQKLEKGNPDLSIDGKTVTEQLAAVRASVDRLVQQLYDCFQNQLLPGLAEQGIVIT